VENKSSLALCVFLDVFWTVLCCHQPVPASTDLHAECREQVPRQTSHRNAATSLLNRRQRLQQHAYRYVYLL